MKLIENEKEWLKQMKINECKECGGSGFSEPGTGYDSVCDNCGGRGEHPDY